MYTSNSVRKCWRNLSSTYMFCCVLLEAFMICQGAFYRHFRWKEDKCTAKQPKQEHPELSGEIFSFMQELIAYDGSIQGYSSACYARSQKLNTPVYDSRVAIARCKLSQLDVGDNELAGSLLAAQLAGSTLGAMPEFPAELICTFLGDSQCTAYTQDP